MRYTIVVSLILVVFAGCNQRPSKVEGRQANALVSELTYARDPRTNLCYATVASRHPGDTDQNGLTVTWVPCTPEVLALVRVTNTTK
jgi:hypothetical protein